MIRLALAMVALIAFGFAVQSPTPTYGRRVTVIASSLVIGWLAYREQR